MPLASRQVAIIPDNDEAGNQYATEVANTLVKLPFPATVKIVPLPNLDEGGDLADWPGSAEDLRELIETAEEWTPGDVSAEKSDDLRIEPLEWKPFPVDLLPKPLREFVRSAAASIDCDASLVALPLLSGLASAVGATRRVQLKPNWTEPAVLWTASICRSGTAKSPASEVALQPLQDLQRIEFDRYKDALEAYKEDSAAWDFKVKQAKKRSESPPPEPIPPKLLRYIASDTTVEALVGLLADNKRGLLIMRDELSGFLGGLGQYKSGSGGKLADEAHFLSMHRAGPITVDRKMSGVLYVPRAHACICGNIQPSVFAQAFSQHMASGLAARFLCAMPPETPRRWTDATIPAEVLSNLANVYGQLLALQFDPDGEPVSMPLSEEAQALYNDFFNSHNSAIPDGEALAAAWSKLEGAPGRLALVLQLVYCANHKVTSTEIQPTAMKAAIGITEWFKHEARRLYERLAENPVQRKFRELAEAVEKLQRKHGGAITVRDAHRGLNRFRGVSAEDVRLELDSLVNSGLAEWIGGGKLSIVESRPGTDKPSENQAGLPIGAVGVGAVSMKKVKSDLEAIA